MPGPKPKDPALRRRTNKPSTHEILDPAARAKAPPLTKEILGTDHIHPTVHRWWRVVWRSPMAPRWLESDVEVLYLTAALRNEFAKKPLTALAGEIRQQEARLGLDVMSRRRFDWRIEGPAAPQQPTAAAAPAPVDDGPDPRSVLRVVS